MALEDCLAGLFNLARMRLIVGLIGLHLDFFLFRKSDHGGDHVLGQIDQHRAGTSGGGEVECLADGRNQVLRVVDQVVVLGAGPGDADDINLLEGIVADQRRGHLAGQHHHRDGIHVGGGNGR